LARAHPLLDRAGSSTDLERLRRAFRRYGRRAIDRLVDENLSKVKIRADRTAKNSRPHLLHAPLHATA